MDSTISSTSQGKFTEASTGPSPCNADRDPAILMTDSATTYGGANMVSGRPSSKQEEAMKQNLTEESLLNPVTSTLYPNLGPTNRQQLKTLLQRYQENTDSDQLIIDGYQSTLTSLVHPTLDLPFTVQEFSLHLRLLKLELGPGANLLALLADLVEEPKFDSCLKKMLEVLGWAPYRASQVWKLNNPTFNNWVKGRTSPKANGLPVLERVATGFGLPIELLTMKIPRFALGKIICARGTTAHGRRQSVLVQKEYLLGFWPERLQQQWNLLFKHKTEFDAADMERNEPWRIDENGHSETAKNNKTNLCRFFGFLTLPINAEDPQLSGLGFAVEDLTLGLLADKDLVMAFLKFHQTRAGEINRGQRLIIGIFSTLIRPLTGFVWQLPDYGQHPYLIEKYGPEIVKPSIWQELCLKTHLKLKDKRNFLERSNSYAEPCNREKIKHVLALQNPSEPLFLLAERMEADDSSQRLGRMKQAVHHRNLLIHLILSNNPLRISHIGTLTYRSDNTGQLYKVGNKFHLRFVANDFKAWSHSLNEDYDAPLPDSLTAKIEEYLSVWRTFLADAETCNYVFRPNPENKKGTSNVPMNNASISVILRKVSRRYISEYTNGLSAHDYRHILATTLVKNVVDGIELASLLLHVSRKMIDNHYGHYRNSKLVGNIQNLIASCREIWTNAKAA